MIIDLVENTAAPDNAITFSQPVIMPLLRIQIDQQLYAELFYLSRDQEWENYFPAGKIQPA